MNDNQYNREEQDLIEKARQAAARSRNYSEAEQRQATQNARNEREQKRKNLPLVSPERDRQQNSNQQRVKKNNRNSNQKKPNKQSQQNWSGNQRRNKIANQEQRNIFGYVLSVLMIVLSLILVGVMWIYNILPTTPRLIITGILALFSILSYTLAGKGQYSAKIRKTWNTIATIIVVFLMILSYVLLSGVGFLNSLFASHENVEFEVRVMADSPYQSMSDLNDTTIGAIDTEKTEDIEEALTKLSNQNDINLQKLEYENYSDAIGELYGGYLDSLLFNNAKLELIKEAYANFETETRILERIQIKTEIKDLKKSVNTSKEPFNVYISGIDTYGDISSVSRSDVNILMTVDPKEKEILMTNLPRDTYVEIAGTNGGYDKLTHAGVDGIETSINTISNFLDTEINYFARVNFTSLIELVDVLGGIELDNPVAFPTNDGNYYFEQGLITLNGEEALAYSRERYNLEEGDIGRGKNQMRVIEAMINKAISPDVIKYADELISKFSEVAETNMPTKDISNLVNVQISNNEPWKFETQTLIGYGRDDLPSYNMPGYALYMYEPDQDSLDELKDNIQRILK